MLKYQLILAATCLNMNIKKDLRYKPDAVEKV